MSMNPLSFNLVELGHFTAFLAFAVAIVQALAPVAARVFDRPALRHLSVNAAVAVFALTTIGGATLIHAFVNSNFSVMYVAQTSNSLLPMFYKVTALWGGHEGSLYLWVWVLALYTLFVAFHGAKRYPDRLPVVMAVQGALMVGFFGLILFLSNPFERLFPIPEDGRDLNPLLQHPGMVIHPPMLYLGYVGFSVPFAFAIAALITRWKSELWIGIVRRWALVAWCFLTTGIVLGAWWAYAELGWGGYWAWDPVENASFMPWLMGTALIHSITVQERRRMLHAWNAFLIITTFSLSLLGTFLVRSGVLSSVHAFAVDPGRGAYILAFMVVVLTVSFGLFLARGRYQLAEEAITSPISRESLFIWNNVLFTVATVVVLLGTLYPLALETLSGAKITVGAPYFNVVMVPIFLLVLFLMAIGPLVPWRKANLTRLRDRLMVPTIFGIAAAVVKLVWTGWSGWVAPVAIGLVGFVFGTLATDYWRAVKQRRAQQPSENLARAAVRTVSGNRRHYGGMIVHFGVLIITIGLVGSGLFKEEKAVSMAPGDVVEIGGEQLRFEGATTLRRDNYIALQGQLRLLETGELLTPERRKYPVQEMPTTEAAIHLRLSRDLYATIGEPVGAAAEGRWAIHLYVFPLVQFLWIGAFIIVLGIVLSLSFKVRHRAQAPATAASAHAK